MSHKKGEKPTADVRPRAEFSPWSVQPASNMTHQRGRQRIFHILTGVEPTNDGDIRQITGTTKRDTAKRFCYRKSILALKAAQTNTAHTHTKNRRISICTTTTAAVWSVLGGAGPAMAFATALPSAKKPISSRVPSASQVRSKTGQRQPDTSSTSLHALPSPLTILRGGAAAASPWAFFDSSVGQLLSTTFSTSSPSGLFNAALALTTVGIKTAAKLSDGAGSKSADGSSKKKEEKPKEIKSLQIKFLSVFWLLRLSDWLQGPYFYEGEFLFLLLLFEAAFCKMY